MSSRYDGLALFSGGLDSILACRILADQGQRILGVHFTSPFFGHPDRVSFWREEFGVEVVCVDLSEAFVAMLAAGPGHGFGKDLNPCVDCKILMLRRIKTMLAEYGADFLITGEVLGQRPMSQRRDALTRIQARAGVADVLVRPLSAAKLLPSPPERSGRVDRSRLLGLWGRGRQEQLRLAREVYGFRHIPQPGGGCALTDRSQVGRFWHILCRATAPTPGDFALARLGRHFFRDGFWLVVARDERDSGRMEGYMRPGDLWLQLRDVNGPVGICRSLSGEAWSAGVLDTAAGVLLSYAPRVRRTGGRGVVRVMRAPELRIAELCPGGDLESVTERLLEAEARRGPETGWASPDLEGFREWKRAQAGWNQSPIARGQIASPL